MINIDRSDLFSNLLKFSQGGSGLVVGNPGVGKSYLLSQLKNHFLNSGIVCFLLKIDNLSEATDSAIQNELGLPEPWIEMFKKIEVIEGQKALLIFDTFDAARNEDFKKAILDQIRKTKKELATKWNILVSVRTYDAQKSQQLIQLFPYSEDFADFTNCRKCTVPMLMNAEVQVSISGDERFKNFYAGTNPSFREILRVPFFLRLADIVLHEAQEVELEEIKQFKSETQLLKRYWDLKVKGITDAFLAEQLLITLTSTLVEKKALSVAKKEFSIPDKAEAAVYYYLRSEKVLEEVSIGGSRIAFGHNILFDYAVSLLYLTSETASVIRFIKEDNSRPFFLRPSFLYFFSQLWYEDRALFWKFYCRFFEQPEKVFQLLVRLVLMGVIASEFTSQDDLKPLTTAPQPTRKEVIRNLLQSLRFIRQSTSTQDVQLLVVLSYSLDILYLWEFGFMLDRAIKEEKIVAVEVNACGVAARNFLQYILQLPNSPNKGAVDRLGANRGVELVCLTFVTDAAASRKLLQSLFPLLTTSDFEIYYFTNLAQYANLILPHDPPFVAQIYRPLFAYEETSDAETVMGGSVIMNFRSNRRQDFENTYYNLTELFPQFLSLAPDLAIPVGMEIVNAYIIKDRKLYGADTAPHLFNYKSFECKYIHDDASLWSSSLYYHKPTQLLSVLIDRLKKLLHENDITILQRTLDLYIQHAAVGYTWKILIEFGASALPKFTDYFFDFCIEPVFFMNIDTSFEIRVLIEKGASYFSNDQIRQIEEIVFRLANDSEGERSERFAQRYLSCIPLAKLQLKQSKELLAAKSTVENERPVTFSSYSGTLTTEEWLQESGVDTSTPVVAELLKGQERLSFFNNRWMNNVPVREDFEPQLRLAAQLLERVKKVITEVDEKVVARTLHEIAQTFTYSISNIEYFTPEEFEQAKEVVHYCFRYISEGDKYQEERASASGVYSPTARITASEALPHIAVRAKTDEWVQLMAEAVRDKNAIVRLHVCRNLVLLRELNEDLYWSLIYERLQKEEDAMVAATVLANTWLDEGDVAKATEVLDLAYSNEKLFSWRNSFMEKFILLAVKLWLHRSNERANEILSGAWERDEFQRDVVFETFKEMRILSLGDEVFKKKYTTNVVRWTTIYLNKAAEKLKATSEAEFKDDNKDVKAALTLIDLVIQRCYFVLEAGGRQDQHFFTIPNENREGLYKDLKPLYEKVLLISIDIVQGGLIIGHTAHYFIKALNACLEYDPKDILAMVAKITELSQSTGYTFDSMAIREVVSLTEKLLADHRDLLTKPDSFDNLIFLLDTYMQSGWVDALELLWKLDEIFK